MKITDKSNQNVLFDTLEDGSVFKHEDVFYMKIKETYDSNYNAVRLFDGQFEDFADNARVTLCNNHELIIS